jgi:hypothetical protein
MRKTKFNFSSKNNARETSGAVLVLVFQKFPSFIRVVVMPNYALFSAPSTCSATLSFIMQDFSLLDAVPQLMPSIY